jgi:multiple sugar transport system substrate-binding protein
VAVSAGGGLTGPDGAFTAWSEPNLRALSLLRAMLGDSAISPPETFTGMQEEETRMHFQQGSALFERNWPYAWALHQKEGSPVRGNVGISALPAFPGHEPAATLGGWHAGVSRFARDPAAARKLAGYLVSLPVQKRLALELGLNPARREIYRDPEVLAALPYYRELEAVFGHAVARPGVPYWTRLSEILQRRLNGALAGRQSPEAALRAADAEARTVLRRYGSP